MEIQNQMWVSYKGEPHFIENIRTHNVRIRTLKEDTLFVSIDDLSPIELPQFTNGEMVIYTDTYHQNLIGKLVTVIKTKNNDNAYAPYKVTCGSDIEDVTPFDIMRLNY